MIHHVWDRGERILEDETCEFEDQGRWKRCKANKLLQKMRTYQRQASGTGECPVDRPAYGRGQPPRQLQRVHCTCPGRIFVPVTPQAGSAPSYTLASQFTHLLSYGYEIRQSSLLQRRLSSGR